MGMERGVTSCMGVVESITLTHTRLACYLYHRRLMSFTSAHLITCFEVGLIRCVWFSLVLIVSFVVMSIEDSQHGYLRASSFSLRVFFHTASKFSVQDSCTFTSCFVVV